MTTGLLGFLGGIGLFLVGMETMTAALRAMAGEALRRWLLRLTSTPFRGVLTGAGIAAAMQSSTAVTVMTIGFVGSGLLTFPQSIGVLYGANVGTTVTAWIIAAAGGGLKLGTLALPVLLLGALMAVVGDGLLARIGRLLSGLSILFVGLDMMQASTASFDSLISPGMLPGDGIGGRLALVGLGLGLVSVIQSSSAGVALTLVLIGSGAITFGQATAFVIGLNIGTTLTGFLASIGGGRAMLRAALANFLFNLGTACLAFPALWLFPSDLGGMVSPAGQQTLIALFHTAFNLGGAILFLPVTRPFARLVERIVPDRPDTLAAALQTPLLDDAGTALDAAARTGDRIQQEIAVALAAALAPGSARDLRPLSALPAHVDPAVAKLRDWLSRIRIPSDHPREGARMAALMHMTDHLGRLAMRAREMDRIDRIAGDARLIRPARALTGVLQRPRALDKVQRLNGSITRFALRHRHNALLRQEAGAESHDDAFAETDALRWLDRVADHAERLTLHRMEAEGPDSGRMPKPLANPPRPELQA